MDSAPTAHEGLWLTSVKETFRSYRRMLDSAIAQLCDEELFARPAANLNSVAIILRHLGGNLYSRWTDFLTSDGEKPNRDRDSEFAEWNDSRTALEAHFQKGWNALEATLDSLQPNDFSKTVLIRGEAQSVQSALLRSTTHVAYHVGQIMFIARAVHQGEWNWLTIAPNKSREHNEATWGSAKSRGVAGQDDGA